METEKNVCPVCLEEGEDDKEELVTLTPCGHAVHKSCMLGWIRMNSNSCPLCRSSATNFHDGEKIIDYPMIGASPDGGFVSEVVLEYPYSNHSAFRNRFDLWSWPVYGVSDHVGRRYLRNNSINEARHNQTSFSDRESRIRSIRFWHSIGHPLNLLEEDFDFRMLRHVFFHRGDPIMLKENIYLALKEFDEKVKNWGCKKKVEIRGTAQKQICN